MNYKQLSIFFSIASISLMASFLLSSLMVYAARDADEEACWQKCVLTTHQDIGLTARAKLCDNECVGAGPVVSADDTKYEQFGKNTQCMLGCLSGKPYDQCIVSCSAKETEAMVVKSYEAICLPQCDAFKKNPDDALPFGRCVLQCNDNLVKKYGTPIVAPVTVPTDALNDLATKYQARYYSKCMDSYNNSDAAACCKDLSIADTQSMANRGAFDTPTSAELPVIVDENKCKPVEYKRQCSDFGKKIAAERGQKDGCEQYLNQCIESGHYITSSEQSRQNSCENNYANQRPISPLPFEKYINFCMKSAGVPSDPSAARDLAYGCWNQYKQMNRDYVAKCILGIDRYGIGTGLLLRLSQIFHYQAYTAKSKQCTDSFLGEIDKMVGK